MLTQRFGFAAQPSSLGKVFGHSHDMCLCVCVLVPKYSHDCTLGKGEVLHQDIKTSVLIIEELPDPPVMHRKGEE